MRADIPFREVASHATPGDAWIIVDGDVIDISDFAHPGGLAVLKPFLGHDATAAFRAQHNPDLLSIVRDRVVGRISQSDDEWKADVESMAALAGNDGLAARRRTLPPIARMINVRDLASAAEKVMEPAGWAYYDSGANDEVTLRENEAALARIWLRPRVLVDVSAIDTSTRLLGAATSFPLYVTATALAKLADPEGEVAISRACARAGVPYMVPTLSSCTLEEITGVRATRQTHWFQLYVNRDRAVAKDLIARAEAGGCSALFVTVDAPQLGRRDRDMRFKAPQGSSVQEGDTSVDTSKGTANALSSFIDPSLNWNDLEWIAASTTLPVCLKGIQTGEDAVRAARWGARAIVVSNHGGRQLDYARSGVEMLVEVMDALKGAGLEGSMEVFVDGGIRRGTDILKCLALGASGVGAGRPILYGLAAYGEEGVVKALTLLREELASALMMTGCPTAADVHREHVDTRRL